MTLTIFKPEATIETTQASSETQTASTMVLRRPQPQKATKRGRDFAENVELGSLGSTVIRLKQPIPIRCHRTKSGVTAAWDEANIKVEGSNFGGALIAMQRAILRAAKGDVIPAIFSQYIRP